MGLVIFWSVIALFYFVLAIVTNIALCKLKQDLSKLDDMSPSGIIINKSGKVVLVESTLYKALKAILITDILGFLAAAAAAIVSIIFTT